MSADYWKEFPMLAAIADHSGEGLGSEAWDILQCSTGLLETIATLTARCASLEAANRDSMDWFNALKTDYDAAEKDAAFAKYARQLLERIASDTDESVCEAINPSFLGATRAILNGEDLSRWTFDAVDEQPDADGEKP